MDPISLSFHGGLKWGGSQNMAPNSILMVLVDLDVLQIVGYHYFDHHQPSRVSSVRILYGQLSQSSGHHNEEGIEDFKSLNVQIV